jgi:hypothetical protein
MILRLAAILVCMCSAALAQQETTVASGAVLRGLDKTSGTTKDIEMTAGAIVEFGRLSIVLRECRYPVGNPSGDAYAAVEVVEAGREGKVFSGWFIASAPALSAMDHPRYDVWVMRCTTS